jgi:hypothetical protein
MALGYKALCAEGKKYIYITVLSSSGKFPLLNMKLPAFGE